MTTSEPIKLACHHCGAVFQRVPLAPGEWARCTRCDTTLESHSAFSCSAWLAVILGAVIALIFANVYPVATLVVQGTGQSATFLDAVWVTWQTGYEEIAALTILVGFLLPVVHLAVLLWLFVPLSLGRVPAGFETTLAVLDHLKPWCMIPVFLMATLVAVVKLVDLATLIPGVGLFATVVTAILITALSRLSDEKIRLLAHDEGLNVPHAPLPPAPSPAGIARSWALLTAAVVLYFPANLLPVMTLDVMGSRDSPTIMGSVIELWHLGSWDIALVVFIASVFVPTMKIALMAVLLYLTQRKSELHLKQRTRLYAVIEFVGQWSMLDVFVVILLAALGRFGSLFTIEPGAGAAAFGGVVVLTMLAAMGFDPRLAWRLAGHRRHVSSAAASAHPREINTQVTGPNP